MLLLVQRDLLKDWTSDQRQIDEFNRREAVNEVANALILKQADEGLFSSHRRRPEANSAGRTLGVALLQHTAVLVPGVPDYLSTLDIVCVRRPGANEGHSLVSWATASFEDQWHQLAPGRGVATPLAPHGGSSGHSIFARACPLTRLVAAVGAGNTRVDKDFVATRSIPGRNVETCLIKRSSECQCEGSPCPTQSRAVQ